MEVLDLTPSDFGVSEQWLRSLRKSDRVNVFFEFGMYWFVKELAISHISPQKQHIGIRSASATKFAGMQQMKGYSIHRGSVTEETGFFSLGTGLRVTTEQFDPELGKRDFIAPLDCSIPPGVRVLQAGEMAFSVVQELISSGSMQTDDDDGDDDQEQPIDMDEDMRLELERYEDLMEWFEGVWSQLKAGAFWVGGSRSAYNLVLNWYIHNCGDDYLHIVVPPDCTPSDLLYQLLLTLSHKADKSTFLRWLNPSTKALDNVMREGASIVTIFPKELSERRMLFEKVFLQQRNYRRFRQGVVLLEDAENLTPSALKEVIYLNKKVLLPFFLHGESDELGDRIRATKSTHIQVWHESGEEFDPELLSQVKEHYRRQAEAEVTDDEDDAGYDDDNVSGHRIFKAY